MLLSMNDDADFVWLIRDNQRRQLFVRLPVGGFLPNKLRKGLSNSLKLSLREVSRHLNDFEERKLVQCLNARDPYNKIFKLTKAGAKMQERVRPLT